VLSGSSLVANGLNRAAVMVIKLAATIHARYLGHPARTDLHDEAIPCSRPRSRRYRRRPRPNAAVPALTAAPAIAPAAPAEKGDDSDWVRVEHVATRRGAVDTVSNDRGQMPIRNAKGEVEGRIFFMGYRRTDLPPGTKRPVTFAFNGGTGSASLWLHLGFLGPKRVKLLPEGFYASAALRVWCRTTRACFRKRTS